MKGLAKFLAETWWVFTLAAVMCVAMAVSTGLYFYLFFLPMLCGVALYMSAVRYDRHGNHRGDG